MMMRLDKNSPIPIYFQLQTWLLEQIEQGIFKPGDKIPTEAEFFQMTGLARSTVRKAVQNLVDMGHLVRKRRRGTFVIRREVETDKQPIVGLLIPDIRSGSAPILARGAEDEAAKTRHSLILCDTDDLFVNADFHADRLIEKSIGGVIFVPTAASNGKNQLIIEKFTRKNIPVVLADRTISDADIDSVTLDNFHSAYELTQYLILKGHTRIAIALSTLLSTDRLRLEGYKKALTDHGIPIDPSIIVASDGPYIEKHYLESIRAMLMQRENYSAILAGHDRLALLFYSVAQQMGIVIPDDVSLVGYGDLPFTGLALTIMRQPVYEMGQESMKLVLSRMNGDARGSQKMVLESHLVERSSVRDMG